MKFHATPRLVAPAAAAALMPLTGAQAQDAQPAGDGLKLETVVVTGTSSARTKMRSSFSISTIEGDSVITATASSAAEVLRSVPGIRSESSGGESNANVGVRGIPISAGGARYIQFQEDGLPILQFGDIACATPDTWLRADVGLDRLEVVRGGSASTLASGAPGGIINFITKTGKTPGGSIALTKGLDYDQTRIDMEYGGKLGAQTRFWVGGFQRTGDGGRPGADGTESGGQLRANLTHDLANGGYVRFSLKHLDDHTPTFMPTPVRFVNGAIQQIAGLDPRRAAFYNAGWPLDNTLANNNGRALSAIGDGLHARSDAFGAEVNVDAGGGFRLHNNFRWSRNSGRFIGIFPGDDVAVAPAGTTVASGANAGRVYSGNKFTAVVFNTQVDDVSLMANDLKVSKALNLQGGAKASLVAGLYTSQQTLDLTWNFNQYALSAVGNGAQLLNVPGLVNGSPGFGGCCMNFQDLKYNTTAPYVNVTYDAGPLSVDLGVRHDRQKARGVYHQTLVGFGGTADGTAHNLASPRLINYSLGNTSYSLGANYQLTRDMAVFARVSEGAAYDADRITFFNNPGLVNGSSPTIPTNKVRQVEGGVKLRQGSFSGFATLFFAETDEVNVDLTKTPILVQQNHFKSKGLELEGAWRSGAVAVNGGVTFTDAEQADGRTPKRQAKIVYQLTPTWLVNDALTLGANVVGTSSSRDDGPTGALTITLPAYTAVNAFVSYAFTPSMTLSVAANNLTNVLGYTESNDGRGAARAINGRTVKATLKYTF
jgi:catecholate siderophore receptor